MKKINFNVFGKTGRILAVGLLAMATVSCEKDNDVNEPKGFDVNAKEYFNVVFQGEDGYYVQAHTDITKGTINHEVGFEIPSQRAAYMFTSDNGKSLYSLSYGGGLIYGWDVKGLQDYAYKNTKSIALKMGDNYARWGKLSEKWASIHDATGHEKVYDADEKYLYTKVMARILPIELSNNMEFGETEDIEIPRSQKDIENYLSVTSMSTPVLHNDKAYYALGKEKYDPLTGEYDGNPDVVKYQATTLIVDFPSLDNPRVISSGVATGSAWRNLPKAHVYDGSIYQLSGDYNAPCMLKITDDKYDDSYKLDISTLVNIEGVYCDGWLYADNGIGYIIYFTEEPGATEEDDYISEWGIARLDLKTNDVTIMNLFGQFDLERCQFAKMGLDKKLYMALSPDGEDGNIYIFDPTSTDPNGFKKGATLTAVGGVSYVGVF